MIVIAFDCEGVLMDSMPTLINLSIECVRKYFNIQNIQVAKAEEMVLHFSGGTFVEGFWEALEFFVPGYDMKKAEQCRRELLEKRAAVYKEVRAFPEVIGVLKQLSKDSHQVMVISSGLERDYIEKWLLKQNLMGLFEAIYSGDDGKKKKHIQMLRHKYPGDKIVYIGDSLSEMKLGDKSIGLARQTWQAQPLKEAGASVIINSLDQLLDVL